ncbi:methyl-accepting chemotaxis protein [Ideonella sp. DXS29W]|uniref:Methyl-accepting chemotaxis protein n=1 Tax=Ideonella lacteola TaxID=2984193 RepID=A0ABU9BUM1_9BURK
MTSPSGSSALLRLLTAPRRRLGARLGVSFGLMCLPLLFVGALAIVQSRNLQARFVGALEGSVPALVRLQSLDHEVQMVNMAARDALLAPDDEAAAAALSRIESGRTKIGEAIEALQAALADETDPFKPVVEELAGHSSGVLVHLMKFSRQRKAGQVDEARTGLYGVLIPKMNAFASAIGKAQSVQLKELEQVQSGSAQTARIGQSIIAAALVAAVLGSALLAWRITRGITRPIAATVRAAERIAGGDLSAERLDTDRQDELGSLQVAMTIMQAQLSDLVTGIRRSASNIAHASQEIAGGNLHLSQRTEEAATSLQRTATAMHQLTHTVTQSAESARSAGEMMSSANQAAERGGAVVSEVIDRMGEIAAASSRIADITGVIDGIAFQTNILALNAAVEAARAGDHGKGFAVVASEVRALAQRSATASREIKSLIGDSVAKVESGSKLVEGAGATMRVIVDDVTRVSGVVRELCSAAENQAQGLGEVNGAVRQLDDATQQNAALVVESTTAAESLRSQSADLLELVNRFRLDESQTA